MAAIAQLLYWPARPWPRQLSTSAVPSENGQSPLPGGANLPP